MASLKERLINALLSRKLIHELRQRDDFVFYMILNPNFENEATFLEALFHHFGIERPGGTAGMSVQEMMNAIERFLLQKTVNEGKTLTLIIDEAQKVTESTLEAIRIFLNFETNEYKLLQVVLLGQLELVPTIMHLRNFYDRISLKYVLNPFDLDDTKKMILYRIQRAGYASAKPLFSDEAVEEIHRYTMGYPRRIMMLCHQSLKQLIIRKKEMVDVEIVRELIGHDSQSIWRKQDARQQKIF